MKDLKHKCVFCGGDHREVDCIVAAIQAQGPCCPHCGKLLNEQCLRTTDKIGLSLKTP